MSQDPFHKRPPEALAAAILFVLLCAIVNL